MHFVSDHFLQVVNEIWSGRLVQRNNDGHDIDCKCCCPLSKFGVKPSWSPRRPLRRQPLPLIFRAPRSIEIIRAEVNTLLLLCWILFTCLTVYRYQNFFRIFVWLFFLVTYSLAGEMSLISRCTWLTTVRVVREPLEKLSDHHQSLDECKSNQHHVENPTDHSPILQRKSFCTWWLWRSRVKVSMV